MVEGLMPFDKSWVIRMGVMDLIHEYQDTDRFLAGQTNLSNDLLALKRACAVWQSNQPIDVGQSGTLYRFLQFASWKLGLGKTFLTQGTLQERRITQDSQIIHKTQRELLELTGEPTSQWASAAVLLGDRERLPDAPYKLQVTYEAVDHWSSRRREGKRWNARTDETIRTQAETFLKLLRGENPTFTPLQSEDYCFARAFGYIDREVGVRRWPSLKGHESDRIQEMEVVLTNAREGLEIHSKDHRPIQAVVMWAAVNQRKISVRYPEEVRKSWPRFWDFMASANEAL